MFQLGILIFSVFYVLFEFGVHVYLLLFWAHILLVICSLSDGPFAPFMSDDAMVFCKKSYLCIGAFAFAYSIYTA